MWSEHCSYKHSKPFLTQFPTSGSHVLMGPGEGAGVVDIGDEQAVVLKLNHITILHSRTLSRCRYWCWWYYQRHCIDRCKTN